MPVVTTTTRAKTAAAARWSGHERQPMAHIKITAAAKSVLMQYPRYDRVKIASNAILRLAENI